MKLDPPITSEVTPLDKRAKPLQKQVHRTRTQREDWAKDNLPDRVQLLLEQPFGKDNINQSFTSDLRFRHVLIFLYRSGYLSRRVRSHLEKACWLAKNLAKIIRQYKPTNFQPLRVQSPNWEQESELSTERKELTTACFLHYNFDTASVVRYIGGPHVGAHRDTEGILTILKGAIEEEVWNDLARLFRNGAPAICNAHSTEENFLAFYRYGNHASAYENVDKTMKNMVKDSKKGYTISMDPAILPYIAHLHLTPMGLTNGSHLYKKSRAFFDSSFRPEIHCMAINDWTCKETEPLLKFPLSFTNLCIWIWNMRISYPYEELYPGDNDVAGAFRHGKYNVNLVAMHACIIFDTLFMSTGMTFGDNTSPANWEPIARARQQLSQHFWKQDDIIERAAPYLPKFKLAPPPTPEEQDTFVQATADSFHKGVFDDQGQRKPPTFDHWVDDQLYCDVGEHMHRTLSASVLSLYVVLGFPSDLTPDPLSLEKLVEYHTHIRPEIGCSINTRSMSVGLTAEKRKLCIELLHPWLTCTSFTIMEAAKLQGNLASISRICRWGWATFFALQNALRRVLRQQYAKAVAIMARTKKKYPKFDEMPKAIAKRFAALIEKEVAAFIWHQKTKIPMEESIRSELQYIFTYLSDDNNPWQISIGHLVDRSPTWVSHGDASFDGGGAASEALVYWFDAIWSPELVRRLYLSSKHPDYLHINILEFLVEVVQVAAAITHVEDSPAGTIPHIPVLLAFTDNKSAKKWAHKVSSKSEKGQKFVSILAEMLRRSDICFHSEYIPGVENVRADFISRPDTKLTPQAWREQIYKQDARLKSWRNFLPSPELVSLMSSRLYSNAWQGPPKLPKRLGRFVPASSTTTFSFTL